ncbi:MAG: Sir2 family NAD-dependent protein deacetylase [Atribacterota bacterium]|nr:Sir2 family NAD-dependent protein deacetylase [Atribacterota bacterium]
MGELLKSSRYTVCLTGAGVSTASGIPDFRTPGKGLWSKVNPIEVTSIQAFRDNPSRFYKFYRPRIEELQRVSPNPAHKALAKLEDAGYLQFLITQNIDNLHQRAGSKHIMEIHGNLNQAICIRCGERISSQELIKRIDENKNGIPYCQCGGVLKPDVVLFGEVLSNIEEAIDEASKAELFLAIGSSLQVSPANLLPEYSMAKKGKLVIINYMQTYLDKKAAIVVNQDIGLFLTILCQHLNI